VCSPFEGCSRHSDAGEQGKIRSHSSHNHREVTSTLVSSGGSERAAALQRSLSTRVVTNNTNPLWYRIRQWTIITVQVQLPVPWISQGEFSISSRWLLTTDSWSALVHLVYETLHMNTECKCEFTCAGYPNSIHWITGPHVLWTKLSEAGSLRTLVQLLVINCKGGFIDSVDLVSVTNVPTHFIE